MTCPHCMGFRGVSSAPPIVTTSTYCSCCAEKDRTIADLERQVATCHPTVCGTNGALPADRVGCGKEIFRESGIFRCVDCGVPFHQHCLDAHCKNELRDAKADLATERHKNALLKVVAEAVDMWATIETHPEILKALASARKGGAM